jgi:major membrane immunogen (membrane-anchored lipoprotein)
MKKIFLPVAALTMIMSATLFNSCTKDDTTAPVITLTGGDTYAVTYKSAATFTDPGFSATDEKDGAITPVVTGTVDMNSAGEYTLTYTATDAAGNSASKTRTVTVDAAPYLAGSWSHIDVIEGDTYPAEIEAVTASTSTKNKIYFAKFAGYTGAQPYATLSGSSMTIPAQTFMCGTSPQVNRTFTGTASATFTSGGWTINYTILEGSDTFTGQSVYTPSK